MVQRRTGGGSRNSRARHRLGFLQLARFPQRRNEVHAGVVITGSQRQSPSIGGKRASGIAGRRQGQAEIGLGFGIVGLQPQRLPLRRNRFIGPSHPEQHDAQIGSRRRQLRIDVQCCLVAGSRLCQAAKIPEDHTEIGPVDRAPRCSRDGTLQIPSRLVGAPDAMQHQPQQMVGFRMLRIHRQHGLIGIVRLPQLAALLVAQAARQSRIAFGRRSGRPRLPGFRHTRHRHPRQPKRRGDHSGRIVASKRRQQDAAVPRP